MHAYLEVWVSGAPRVVALSGDRLTLGKDPTTSVVVEDKAVSRLHAVFERYEGGWSVRDLGSSNGTYVNGDRIWAERALRPGDEILAGRTRIVFRVDATPDATRTEMAEAPPRLTPRERDVLVTLCKPVLSGDVFTEPASIARVAAELVVTEAAVKQHLARLYDKFGIEGERRRVRLANEAIRRGAVSVSDLRT